MIIPTISFAPWNLKSDSSLAELGFRLSFPLPTVELEDPELQFLTNLCLVGVVYAGTPWVSTAGGTGPGEVGVGERPGNFLPNFILGMKRDVGTEKPAEGFAVSSTAVIGGVGRLPRVGVPGELWITS